MLLILSNGTLTITKATVGLRWGETSFDCDGTEKQPTVVTPLTPLTPGYASEGLFLRTHILTAITFPDFGDASPCSRVRLLVYFYFLSSMALMLKSGLIR